MSIEHPTSPYQPPNGPTILDKFINVLKAAGSAFGRTRLGMLATANETRTRVVTGVLGAAVLLLLVISGGHYGISFVAAVLAVVMSWEVSQVFYELPDRNEKQMALLGVAWLTICVNMLFPRSMLECLIMGFLGMFTYYLATAERHPSQLKRHFDELVLTVFAMVYIVTFLAFFPSIRDGSNGTRWVLLFLAIVWAGDTAAYFVGRKYGKRKLYPMISPKKTLEGAGGGLAAGLVVTLLFKLIALRTMSWLGVLMIPLLIGVFSQIGDLCESFLKRAYGLKDSGHILPGHGGMLDRFDGVVFSLPVMYFCVRLFS